MLIVPLYSLSAHGFESPLRPLPSQPKVLNSENFCELEISHIIYP